MNNHMNIRLWLRRAAVAGACLTALHLSALPLRAQQLEYNRDIRPILAENCFACHGPDSAARKADLRLDRREAAIKAEAIVPGKPDKSALVERVFSTNPKTEMPPAKAHKKLTAAQKAAAKKRADAAGRRYPNLVDNMWAAKKKAVAKTP